MASLMLPSAGLYAKPSSTHPALVGKHAWVVGAEVNVQAGHRATLHATSLASCLVLPHQPTFSAPTCIMAQLCLSTGIACGSSGSYIFSFHEVFFLHFNSCWAFCSYLRFYSSDLIHVVSC